MASSVPFFGNFNFLVEIEDIAGDATSVVGGFSRVSGLVSESDVIEHRVGSSPLVQKIPGKTRFANIVLEKGCTTSSALYQWRRRIEEGETDRRSGSIILLDGNFKEKARWNFFEAWPCRYEAPELDASDNAISVETLELCVQRIERVEPRGGAPSQ
jgi:phage tail-like protein